MLVKGTITVANTGTDAALNDVDKKVIFKNCALFTSCINSINFTQIDDAQLIDVVMSMRNLIENKNHLEFYGNFVEMYRL